MKKNSVKLIFIFFVIISILGTTVSFAADDKNEAENINKSSFIFSATPDKTEVEPGGEVVTIDLSVSEINLGEHGMNVVGGYLYYDTDFFSKMELVNVNDWEITYNTEEGERNGKFLIVKMVDGIHEEESICQIKVTVNKDLTEGEGTVRLKEIQSNDGEKLVDQGDRTITVRIKQPKKEEKLNEPEKSNNTSTPEKSNNAIENVPDNNTIVKSNITENAKTGDKIAIAFGAIIVVILINFGIKTFRKKD